MKPEPQPQHRSEIKLAFLCTTCGTLHDQKDGRFYVEHLTLNEMQNFCQ